MFAKISSTMTNMIYICQSLTWRHLTFQVVNKLTNISMLSLPLFSVFRFLRFSFV